MSQLDVNVIAPLGYTGPNLPGDNNFVQVVDNAGTTIFKAGVQDNVSVGTNALDSVTTGQRNIAIGKDALTAATTSLNNVAIGHNTLKNITINNTGAVAVGAWALEANTAGGTAVGYQAARNSLVQITAIGINALVSSTGIGNTAVGSSAGFNNTTGTQNTFIGAAAAAGNTITGSSNTCLGYSSGGFIDTGSNNTCLGYNAQVSGSGASDEFILGNANVAVLSCAQTTITSLSDARDKKEVEELPVGLDFVQKLKPVKFVWDDRNEEGKHDIKDFGFIAQDLKAAQEEEGVADYLKLVYEANPDKLQASYGKLIPILVKAIQDLSAKVEALEAQ
jgi:hypothetical protein